MAETFEQYRERVLDYLGNRDPLRILRTTPATLSRLIHRVPRRVLAMRPAPKKWSVIEIIAHLVDTEIAYAWRIRNVLATNGTALPWFDQDRWAKRLNYRDTDPKEMLAAFRSLRRANLLLIESVPRRRWKASRLPAWGQAGLPLQVRGLERAVVDEDPVAVAH